MSGAARPPSPALGVLTVVLTLTGWSSIPLFLRYFADSIDLWTSNGWRYGFSALVWAPVLIIAALRIGLPKGLWRKSSWNQLTANALVPDSLTDLGGGACFNDARVEVSLLSKSEVQGPKSGSEEGVR